MVNRFSTYLAYGIIVVTALVLVGPTVIGEYYLFELTSFRPLSTILGAIWLMLVAISAQLADVLETEPV